LTKGENQRIKYKVATGLGEEKERRAISNSTYIFQYDECVKDVYRSTPVKECKNSQWKCTNAGALAKVSGLSPTPYLEHKKYECPHTAMISILLCKYVKRLM
jgi:hypothetical protein